MKKISVVSQRLCAVMVSVLLLSVFAASGCKKADDKDTEAKLRDAFNSKEGFNPNKLTPEQRAGFEKAMKQGGAPPSAPGAPR